MEDGREIFRGELHEITEKIIGAFLVVVNELGTGFLESVYRRALSIALREVGLHVQEEVAIPVWFHGQSVGVFKADMIVNGVVILELKVADEINRAFEAQLLHYLRATDIEVGMVLAFGMRGLVRRMSMGNDRKLRLKTGTGIKGTSRDKRD